MSTKRVWPSGEASGFQPDDAGSTPAARSTTRLSEDVPCPFCGGRNPTLEDIFEGDVIPTEHQWFMACIGCGASGPAGDTPERATELWNRRGCLQ